jgi:hypothetical protein
MYRAWICAMLVCLPALASAGCAKPIVARYIYQDNEFGVVGIPVNTYQKKVDYRDQAEMLMARHFPVGYEIVRAEEVVEGERIRDVGKRTEVDAQPGLATLSQVVLKLGRLDRVTSYEQKDKLQVRECRIIYKRKSLGSPGQSGQFAQVTSLAPALYIDPNQVMRQQIKTTADQLARADSPAKKVAADHPRSDPDVKQASAVPSPPGAAPPSSPDWNWNWSCEPLILR